jgi:hypothetical protein
MDVILRSYNGFDLFFHGKCGMFDPSGPDLRQIAKPSACSYNVKMLTPATSVILALILSIAFMAGCSSERPAANNANGNTAAASQGNENRDIEPGLEGAKDNPEELATLVKLPYTPEDLVWKELPAKQGRRVVAVFQLTEEDAKKLIGSAAKARAGSPVSLKPENWFPRELTTQTDVSGEETLPATAYPADEFFQPPFTEGTVSNVDDTNFFVLEVFAR